ncbi:MAG TPA: hypothetical protein VIJ12_08615 [Candidatus Baltobacteraceae bacterium]
MPSILRIALRPILLTLAIVAFLPPLHAEARYGIITYNMSSYRAWITIQDLGKTRNLDWGWVDGNSKRTWESGNYAGLSYYHVRFEYVNASGHKVCDTSIQIVVPFPIDSKGSTRGYYDEKTGKCYLDFGPPSLKG